MKVYQLVANGYTTLYVNEEVLYKVVKQCINILTEIKTKHNILLEDYKAGKIKHVCHPIKSEYVKTKYLDDKEKHNEEMKRYRNAWSLYHKDHGNKYTKEQYELDVNLSSKRLTNELIDKFRLSTDRSEAIIYAISMRAYHETDSLLLMLSLFKSFYYNNKYEFLQSDNHKELDTSRYFKINVLEVYEE